jgi:hypothetical protein
MAFGLGRFPIRLPCVFKINIGNLELTNTAGGIFPVLSYIDDAI